MRILNAPPPTPPSKYFCGSATDTKGSEIALWCQLLT